MPKYQFPCGFDHLLVLSNESEYLTSIPVVFSAFAGTARNSVITGIIPDRNSTMTSAENTAVKFTDSLLVFTIEPFL